MHTLALHLGALGDFVLSWPALGFLAGDPPAGRLTLWGQPAWGRLVLPAERVHDREAGRFAGLWAEQPGPDLRAWLQGFGRAVVFAQRPDPRLMANLSQAMPQVWALPTRPAPGQVVHASEVQVQALRGLGLNGPAQPLPVRLEAPAAPGPPVLAPGSGGRAKRLAPALAAGLAGWLGARWQPPLVVLGPAEDQAYREALGRGIGPAAGGWLLEPDMPALAAALLAAPAYVGADSGVSHLAAALGATSLAIFQASDPAIWAPRGPRARHCSAAQAARALKRPAGLDAWLAGD